MKIDKNISLKEYTTFKIGGYAEFFSIANTKEDLINLVKFAKKERLPITILGGGSNILISDKGIKGLTIINKYKEINISDIKSKIEINDDKSFYREGDYFKFTDLEEDEKNYDQVIVNVSSGINLTYLINDLLSKNITGIQYFSAIPGTLGGAIFNNIHGGSKLIGNYLYKAKVLSLDGDIEEVDRSFFKFGYDYSVLHENKYILLSSNLILFKGDVKKARETSIEWLKRKTNIQPKLPSAGSIFKNITDEQRERIQSPVNSAGWIIDQCGLKGERVGGAQIYEKHANYIVNTGNATEKEVKGLIDKVQNEVYKKFRIKLSPEIIFKS